MLLVLLLDLYARFLFIASALTRPLRAVVPDLYELLVPEDLLLLTLDLPLFALVRVLDLVPDMPVFDLPLYAL